MKELADRTSDQASHAAGHATEKVKGLADQTQDAAAALGSRVQGAASSASEMASEVIDRVQGLARDGVRGVSDSMPGSASDAYQAGQRAIAQGGDSLGRQVAGRPLEALLLAGAIGYLVGWATSRS